MEKQSRSVKSAPSRQETAVKLQLIKHTFIHALVDTSKKAHLVGINYEIRFIIYRVISGSQESLLFISVTSECKVPRVLHALDYYSLWLFHVSTNDTKVKLETIRQDFRALGMMIKDLGAQTFFSQSFQGGGRMGGGGDRFSKLITGCATGVGNRLLVPMTMGPCLKTTLGWVERGSTSLSGTCLCQQVGQARKEGFKL